MHALAVQYVTQWEIPGDWGSFKITAV